MKLKVLSLEDVEQARIWRNECLEALRTSFPLTKEMQSDFYKNIICDRNAKHRFWGIHEKVKIPYTETIKHYGFDEHKNDIYEAERLIGMTGLENIELENRRAEISIILDNQYRGMGNGIKAVELLLDKGFNHMNLDNIYGEVYFCNEAVAFWEKIINTYRATSTLKRNTKYYAGGYWDSLWFNIERDKYREVVK